MPPLEDQDTYRGDGQLQDGPILNVTTGLGSKASNRTKQKDNIKTVHGGEVVRAGGHFHSVTDSPRLQMVQLAVNQQKISMG